MTKFRTNADGSLVCQHRDLSVCNDCAVLPNVREVFGVHYLMDDAEYGAYLIELADLDA